MLVSKTVRILSPLAAGAVTLALLAQGVTATAAARSRSSKTKRRIKRRLPAFEGLSQVDMLAR